MIKKNEEGRDFVVSDIHGMYDDFMAELDAVDFNTEFDRMFSVGDLIDRGPDNTDCLDLLYAPWFFAVLGNHEKMFLEGKTNKYMYNLHKQNGGGWVDTLDKDDYDRYIDLVQRKMPLYRTLELKDGNTLGICHAQPPTDNWDDMDTLTKVEKETAVWGRTMASKPARFSNPIRNVTATVHGHTILAEPGQINNCHFIDTGGFLPHWDDKGYISVFEVNELV